jgi:CheY-like chemotaxis protein
MLAYSGRGRFVVEPTDLGALVGQSLPLLKVALPKRVALRTQLSGELPLVEADAGQIQQVVMNLVINASEALGERGGTITVSTGVHDLVAGDERFERITGQPLPPGHYVSLEVRDDGPGIEPGVLSRIFDPFFTTKFTGRGLGLAAVLGVIRAHQGGLHVESMPGGGSRFRLLFAPSARAAPEREPARAPTPGRRLRLLLIDDEDVVREVLAELLELQGFEVVAAHDGEGGLALFGERGEGFDLVLLDLSMPGLGGEATWARLVERRPDIPVILSSGHDRDEALRRFGGRLPTGFIQKPYRPAQLVAEIRRCVPAAAAASGQ